MEPFEQPTVRLGGTIYKTRIPDMVRDAAEIEAYVKGRLKDPIEAILPMLDKYADNPLIVDRLTRHAYQDLRQPEDAKPPADLVQRFLSSTDGSIFVMWLMLRDDHPKWATLAAVQEQVKKDIAKAGQETVERELREFSKRAASAAGGGQSTDPAGSSAAPAP